MLGGSLEDNVLCAIVWSETLAPQIALRVKASDFSTRTYRTIAAAGFDFLNRHHRPARAHIGDILEHDIRRGPEGRFMSEVVREMEVLAPHLDERYVLGELDHFLEIQHLSQAVQSASDLLSNGELDKAREVLRAPNLLPKDNPGVYLRNTDDWLGFLRDEEDVDLFSSGIDVLDDRRVRPARGEFFALLAAAGRGKSWFLVNAGKRNVVDERKNVLHITLENSLEITLERYTQALLGLTRDEAKAIQVGVFRRSQGDFSQVNLEYDNPTVDSLRSIDRSELVRRLGPFQRRGQLLVKHFPTGSLTLGMLAAYLDALERTESFKPDLVLIDYLALMHLDARDLRISMGQLARNLRGLAEMRGFALVTAVQAQRSAYTMQLVTSRAIAEDWSIVTTADTFLTYSQTLHERERHVARILVDKARNATDKWLALITQSYEIGQFCLDSNYMTASLRDQLTAGEEDDENA